VLRYIFTDEAMADLDAIDIYLTERDPAAGVRVFASLIATIERACIFPDAAPALDEPGEVLGTRKLVEPTYKYVAYYRVVGQSLIVLRVFHGAQQR